MSEEVLEARHGAKQYLEAGGSGGSRTRGLEDGTQEQAEPLKNRQ